MAIAKSGNRSSCSKFAPIFAAPTTSAAMTTVIVSAMTSRVSASSRPHRAPAIMASGSSHCRASGRCRRHSLLRNLITFQLSMTLYDPKSYPKGACIPDSDQNTPSTAGSALLELQFYPPGFPPYISQIGCDLAHWCAALTIDSLEVMSNGKVNPNCAEPVTFAFIHKNGIPTGPPGPASATAATLTPNPQTLLVNQGDRIRVTITAVC